MMVFFSQLNNSYRLQWNIEKIREIRFLLLSWFAKNGRHTIPWKLTKEGLCPNQKEFLPVYPILVAEVMLQQTQLKVVLPYWTRWMETFPTLADLVKADEQNVLLLWQGLGYYSRAKRLLLACNILLESIGEPNFLDSNNWPKDLETWISLPGIGPSTAGSIISSAFNLPVPLLDGNAKRVISRLTGSLTPPEDNLSNLWEVSAILLDRDKPRDFNQALMDLGATICTKYQPICERCPWKDNCLAYDSGTPTNFPKKGLKRIVQNFTIGIGVLINSKKEVLIDQRLDDMTMGGMWEFPGGKQEKNESIEITIARELNEELGVDVKVGKKLVSFDHSYTHRKLHFIVHLCELNSGIPKPLCSQQICWVKVEDLSNYPFPKANEIIIDALQHFFSNRTE